MLTSQYKMAWTYMILVLIVFFAHIYAQLLYCDEDIVTGVYRFRPVSKCAPRNNETGETNVQNGTVFLFKPNLDYIEIPAEACSKQITVVRAWYSCFLKICHGRHTQYYTYHYNVSVDECRRWLTTGNCNRFCAQSDGDDMIYQDYCPLIETLDENVKSSNLSHDAVFKSVWFGDTSHYANYTDCVTSKGVLRSVNPWKTLVSPQWGVLETSESLSFNKSGVALTDSRTVMWPPPNQETCTHVLYSDEAGHLINLDDKDYHVVIPALTATFQVNKIEDTSIFSSNSHLSCLHSKLRDQPYAQVFKTSEDMLIVFIPSNYNANVILSDDTAISLHTKLQSNNGMSFLSEFSRFLESRRVRRDVDSHDNVIKAINVQSEIEDAHLNYFINALQDYNYQNALTLSKKLCDAENEIYSQWLIQSKFDPSRVLSYFLNQTVIAKQEADLFYVYQCNALDPSDYDILPTLRDPAVPDRCFRYPVVRVSDKNSNQSYLAQVSPEGNRLLQPHTQFTELCPPAKSNKRRLFKIGSKTHIFEGNNLLPDTTLDVQVTPIGPKTRIYFSPEKQILQVKHLRVYNKTSSTSSLLSLKEWLDYTKMRRTHHHNRNIPGREKYLPTPPLDFSWENGWFLGGLDSALSWIFNLFTHPLLRLVMLFYISIGTSGGCVYLIKWLRPCACLCRPQVIDSHTGYEPVVSNSQIKGLPQ